MERRQGRALAVLGLVRRPCRATGKVSILRLMRVPSLQYSIPTQNDSVIKLAAFWGPSRHLERLSSYRKECCGILLGVGQMPHMTGGGEATLSIEHKNVSTFPSRFRHI